MIAPFVRDDIEVAIVIEIRCRRGAGAGRTHDGDESGPFRAERVLFVRSGTIQREEFLFNSISFAGFDAEDQFAIDEAFAAFVQQEGIDRVAQRIAHAGGHKHIFVTVCVQVGDADAPRPERFRADRVGDLNELAAALILIERISKDAVGSPRQILWRPFDGAPCLALLLLELCAVILLAGFDLNAGHV